MQYAVWSSACHAALRSAGAGFDLYRIEGAGHIEAALDRETLRGSVAFLAAELPTQGADRQPEWVSFVFDDGVGFPQRRRDAEGVAGSTKNHVRSCRLRFDGVGEHRTGYCFRERKKLLRRKRQHPSA